MEKRFGVTIARTLEDLCDPAEMALLVYDMQVGIVRQVKDGAAVVARVSEALDIARVGIEPTARHAADLGFVPVIIPEACGTGQEEAAKRSVNALEFAGDSIFTEISTFRRLLCR